MLQGSLGVFLENGYTNMIYVERSCFCSKKHDFEYMFAMAFVNILGRDTRPIFRLDKVKKLKEIYCSMEDDCATCQMAPVVIHGFQQAEMIPSHRQVNIIVENPPFLVGDTSSNTWVFHGHVGHVSFQWCALPKLATAGSPQNGEGRFE